MFYVAALARKAARAAVKDAAVKLVNDAMFRVVSVDVIGRARNLVFAAFV